MKKFEVPEMKIIVYEVEDIITTSGTPGGDDGYTNPGENQTPWN